MGLAWGVAACGSLAVLLVPLLPVTRTAFVAHRALAEKKAADKEAKAKATEKKGDGKGKKK